MTAMNPNNRPDFKSILERKIQWDLEPSHLKDNPFVVNAEKFFQMLSLENYVISRFIKLKLKNLKEDFGNREISSETFHEPKMNERTGKVSKLTINLEKLRFIFTER
jgi:hypothetical protein